MLMMLLTEFLIIMLFLLVFLSFKFNSEQPSILNGLFFYFFGGALIIFFFSVPYISSKQFSATDFVYLYALDIVSHDLYFFFFYFFVDAPLASVYIATILGLISIFFVSVYFGFKHYQQADASSAKYYAILRKQNLTKQANYKTPIRIFQK